MAMNGRFCESIAANIPGQVKSNGDSRNIVINNLHHVHIGSDSKIAFQRSKRAISIWQQNF